MSNVSLSPLLTEETNSLEAPSLNLQKWLIGKQRLCPERSCSDWDEGWCVFLSSWVEQGVSFGRTHKTGFLPKVISKPTFWGLRKAPASL